MYIYIYKTVYNVIQVAYYDYYSPANVCSSTYIKAGFLRNKNYFKM